MEGAHLKNLSFAGSGVGYDDGRGSGRICRAKGHVYERERYNPDTQQEYMEVGEQGSCLLCGHVKAKLVGDNEHTGD